MAERRMLLNSTEESFIGTMRIEYYSEDGKLNLDLNDNIKIIEEYFDDENGYYVVGFEKDLIIPEYFINYNGYCEICLYSDYNIIFDARSIYGTNLCFFGNFTFNEGSIMSYFITLYDYNYIFNDDCFELSSSSGFISFAGKTIAQHYKNTNSYLIYAYPHILYDLMKYNNIEEGDEEAKNYIIDTRKLIISSPTEYNTEIPNVDLGSNNYITIMYKYKYNENYITEYTCNSAITHLRKGITLPQDATVYFPDSVTDIDSDTFGNEGNLKKVVIFGNCNLTYLDGLFGSGLENIEIYSDKIEIIKEYCFGNSDLKTISIHKSVKYIEGMAFDHLNYPFIINYNGTINEWNSINFNSYWMGSTPDIIVNCTDGSLVVNLYELCRIYYTSTDGNIINVDTEYINNNLLSNTYEDKGLLVFENAIDALHELFIGATQLKEIWLPDCNIAGTVNAFADCTHLITVNNSKQLKTIDEHTFGGCENLQQIEIDSDWIGDLAFSDCTSLTYVKISKRIESISEMAFKNCTSLESIDYEGIIEEWNNIDIDSTWRDGSAITTIHCSDGDIQL